MYTDRLQYSGVTFTKVLSTVFVCCRLAAIRFGSFRTEMKIILFVLRERSMKNNTDFQYDFYVLMFINSLWKSQVFFLLIPFPCNNQIIRTYLSMKNCFLCVCSVFSFFLFCYSLTCIRITITGSQFGHKFWISINVSQIQFNKE